MVDAKKEKYESNTRESSDNKEFKDYGKKIKNKKTEQQK